MNQNTFSKIFFTKSIQLILINLINIKFLLNNNQQLECNCNNINYKFFVEVTMLNSNNK